MNILEIPNKCTWTSEEGIDALCYLWVPIGNDLWIVYHVYVMEEKLRRFKGLERFLIYNPN